MDRPLRIGLIGAGANTRERHIPGFRTQAGVELVTVANRTTASAQKVATEYAIPHVAADWQSVVADAGVDAICIGTWPYLHAEITCAALVAGKHVLTEARMARDLPEAELMLAASRAHPGLVAQVVPSPMTLDCDATIRGMIASGALGEVREICVTHTMGAYANPDSPLTWRQDVTLSGHNTLSLGIYYEAVLRWMDEDVRVDAAQAGIFTKQRRRSDGSMATVEIPESLTVLGHYRNGCRLVMHLSGVESGPARNEIRINGSKAGLRLAVPEKALWHARAGRPEEPVSVPAAQRRGWRVEEDFVASIRDGAPVQLTDFATGVRTMRFTDEVWAAWQR